MDARDMELQIGTRGASDSGRGGCGGRLAGSLLFGLFFLIGSLFVVFILGEAIRTAEPWFWPRAACTIVSSGVDDTGDDENPYRPVVRYSYEFDGRTFEGRRFSRSDGGTASFDSARDRAARYPAGTEAVCYVDPAAPSLAVLQRSLPWIALAVFFPLIFVAVGGVGLWAIWRRGGGDDRTGIRSISQRAAGGRGHQVMVALGVIFALVGTATFVPLFAVPMWRLAAAATWEAVPCLVVGSSLRSWSTDDGTAYRADVLYEYDAGGKRWRSNRVDFFSILSQGRDSARETLADYPRSARATCWVDPTDPSRSVLQREFKPRYLLGGLTAIFLVAGVAIARYGWRQLATRRHAAGRISSEPAARAGPIVLRPKVGPLGKVGGALFFALFWNGIVSVFVWQAWKSWSRGDPDWFLTIFLIPFVLIGLGAIAFVGYFLLATVNPRPVVTLLDGHPSLGREMRLEWRFSGRSGRLRRLEIVLEGREEATYRRGTDTITDREVFSTTTLVDTGNDWEMVRGQAAAPIPHDTMHSLDGANNAIVWELKVKGEISRWPDVDEALRISVAPLPLEEV